MNSISFETRKHLTASGVTVLTMLVLLLLLYIIPYSFPVLPPPIEEMGMLVNLGDSENGSGDIQPLSSESESATAVSASGAGNPSTAEAQQIETQENDADAAAVQSAKTKKQQTDLKQKPDDKANPNTTVVNNDAAIAAKKKAKEAADKKAKEDAFKSKLKNALNKSNNSTSEGVGTGTGDQGVPDGDPNASNHTGVNSGLGTAGSGYSIKGLKGRVPRKKPLPQDNSKDVGKVAVNITVDNTGKVIKATFTEKGSTTSSLSLRNAAIKAAKEWRFNEKATDNDETGTIIFNFTNR